MPPSLDAGVVADAESEGSEDEAVETAPYETGFQAGGGRHSRVHSMCATAVGDQRRTVHGSSQVVQHLSPWQGRQEVDSVLPGQCSSSRRAVYTVQAVVQHGPR